MTTQSQADQYGTVGGEAVYNAPSISNKDEEVRIVLLGRTGSGKSSSGNTILDTNAFRTSLSATAVTRECKRGTCTRFGRRLQVIDTPGLYDSELTTEDMSREVVKCVEMTAPGPHAFIFVVRVDRFTEEEQNTIEYFMKLFGRGMLNYLIILVTKKDELIYNGQTVEDYIGNDSSKLKSVLNDCGGRYVMFNNRGSEREKEQDVQTLVEIIDKMVQDNGGKVYTNAMFQEAEKVMKEREDQLKREKEEALTSQLDEIRSQVKQLEASTSQLDEIRSQVKQLEASTSQLDVIRSQVRQLEKDREEVTDQLLRELEQLGAERDYQSSTRDCENIIKLFHDLRLRREREIQAIRAIGAGEAEVNFREQAEKNGSFLQDKILPALQALGDQAARPFLIAFGFGAFLFGLHRLHLMENVLATVW